MTTNDNNVIVPENELEIGLLRSMCYAEATKLDYTDQDGKLVVHHVGEYLQDGKFGLKIETQANEPMGAFDFNNPVIRGIIYVNSQYQVAQDFDEAEMLKWLELSK